MVQDHSSLSNLDDVTTIDLLFDLTVQFENQMVTGTVEEIFLAKRDDVREIWLDTRDISVHSLSSEGHPLRYELETEHKVLGSRLKIYLDKPLSQGSQIKVLVEFSTSRASTALQWLQPAQTAGKKLPYLFSQAQAIHARSFVPCQDAPSVKSRYTARVAVPKALKALMSANLASETGESDPQRPEYRTFTFTQDIPIPSYLLAIAVGNLESRSLGPRSKVWSEPEVVEAAAWEFQDTADFLKAGEQIAGPYPWGSYDILLLPPSFPYGGMENPCLTFATPTLLAGDRSLVGVIAHEIAHSWTGNLVSNETWQDFWLNEGWTVYMERRILGHLKGEATEEFQSLQGHHALQDSINHFGSDHPFTQLVPDLSGGIDPDDSFSKVPYEKGFYLLTYLQKMVGGKQVFEDFMRAYIREFAHKSINSQQFKAYFLSHFQDIKAVEEIDWQLWLYGRGMPPQVLEYNTQLAEAAHRLANAWHAADAKDEAAAEFSRDSTQMEEWSTDQVVAFLVKLLQLSAIRPLSSSATRTMNALYHLDDSRNAEICAVWYRLCMSAGDKAVLPLIISFLKEQGRMKYLRPLYQALAKSSEDIALQTYSEACKSYHPIAAKMVASDLHINKN